MPEFSRIFLRLLAIGLFFAATPLHAGHIVGGEIAYACRGWKDGDASTGIKVYDVRINMYRDNIGQGAYFDGVNGVEAGEGPQGNSSAPGNYTIYRGTTLFVPTESLILGPVSPVDVNLGNPCLLLTEPADQQIGVYEFTIELPVSNEPYTIAYQRCCRNSAIRNLEDADKIGSTYFIEVTPEAQERCNASPRFNIDPPIAICIAEQFRLDLGATDREGDSLAYSLCNPVVGGGDSDVNGPLTPSPFDDVAPRIESPPPYANAAWEPAPTGGSIRYDVLNQLGDGSDLAVNDTTGLMSGRPVYPGTFALAVCVEEWALDTASGTRFLISETKREFQLVVNVCGTRVRADLEETSIDDQGRFYIRTCGLGEQLIVNESTEIDAIDTYTWTLEGPGGRFTGNNRDFTADITRQGIYNGSMVLNTESFSDACKDEAEFIIEIYPGIDPDFENTESNCNNIPIEFTNRTTTERDNFVTAYSWDFADGINSADSRRDPVYQYPTAGRFGVRLSAVDNNGCEASVVREVTHLPRPDTMPVPADSTFACIPYERTFINGILPVNEDYTFEWRFGDGGESTERSPTHTYEQEGIYDVYLKVTSPIGCSLDTTLLEFVDARLSPIAGFSWQPEQLSNLSPTFNVIDEAQLTTAWRYAITDFAGRSLFSTFDRAFEYTLRDTAVLNLTQVVLNPSGCTDSLTQQVGFNSFLNTYFVPNAFTPNGDGLNDLFGPVGILEGITEYQLRVWTRYGERVFTTEDPSAVWDGTFNGTPSPGGGYLWDASYVDANGDRRSFKGGVTLVR